MGAVKKKQPRPKRRRSTVDYEAMSFEELEAVMQPRQIKFVEELDKGGTDAECYVRAGYSEKGAAANASHALADPKIIAYKKKRTQKLYRDQGITPEWIGMERIKLYKKAEKDGNDRLAAEILKAMMADMGSGQVSAPEVRIIMPQSGSEEWSK